MNVPCLESVTNLTPSTRPTSQHLMVEWSPTLDAPRSSMVDGCSTGDPSTTERQNRQQPATMFGLLRMQGLPLISSGPSETKPHHSIQTNGYADCV